MIKRWLKNHLFRSKIRITDLKIGHLVKILRYLDLNDLLNLANSNKYLKRAAECVFLEKYGHKKVWLYKIRPSSLQKYSVHSNLLIKDFKMSLYVVRLFGHLISELEISEDEDFKKHFHQVSQTYQMIYKHLFNYINHYCCRFLTILNIVMIPECALDYLTNSFIRVKSVTFFGCQLGSRIASFDELFPNAMCMKLQFNEIVDPYIIEQHMRCLKHLEINIDKRNFKNENVEEVLCLNPQLRRLKVGSGWSAEFLDDISIFLQFIEVLEFDGLFEGFSDFNGPPIHFENVKRLKLNLSKSRYATFPRIPLSFVQLNELVLEIDQELGEEFYNFIGENQTISILSIPAKSSIFKGFNGTHFVFRKELAYLSEINICRYTFSSNDHIVNLLKDFKTLTRISFTIDNFEQYHDLAANIADKWHISIISNTNCVELIRKPTENILKYIEQFLDDGE